MYVQPSSLDVQNLSLKIFLEKDVRLLKKHWIRIFSFINRKKKDEDIGRSKFHAKARFALLFREP